MPNFLEQQSVLSFIVHPDRMKILRKLVGDYGLEVDKIADELESLVIEVIKGEISYNSIPEKINIISGVDEPTAKKIAADLAGYYLLPLSLYIGGIKNKIIEWGGDPESYPKIVVEKEKIHPEELILELAKKIGLELPEPMMKRFVYLGRGFLTGERDREATMLLFKRPINIGGLELTDDETLKCLDLLSVEKGKFEVVEMEMGVDATPSASAVGVGSSNPVPVIRPVVPTMGGTALATPTPASMPMMFPKEKIDEMLAMPDFNLISPRPRLVAKPAVGVGLPNPVPAVTRPVPVVEVTPVPKAAAVTPIPPNLPLNKNGVTKSTTTALVKSVSQALAKEVPVISGEMMAPHEKKEIELATKKIVKQQIVPIVDKKKTEAEVNALLATVIVAFKAKGLTKQDFTEAAQAHVKGLREAHQTERLLLEKFNFDQAETDSIMKTLESARQIANSAVGIGLSNPVIAPAPSTTPSESAGLDLKHASLTGQMPTTKIEPLMPTARVSAARTKDEEVAGQVAKIDETKIKDAMSASLPEKAKAMISAASAPPTPLSSGPITDVKFAPHLTGPVEELGHMTPEQFRRLSSDPMEAMAKIFDKLSLLQTLSYSDRVRGIEAWRLSPMSHLYLQMAGEALRQGVAIAEISTRRRNAGQDSLSPVEIKAVMELNKRIKF